MTESEQAQAIERIRRESEAGFAACRAQGRDIERSPTNTDTLLEIVDSQAQKIAEQVKEIERLTKERNDARKLAEDSRDDEYDNDMDLSLAENRLMRREYAKAHPLPWEKQ